MNEHRVLYVRSRFAAPAPERAETVSTSISTELDWQLHRWGAWSRSRKLYGAPRANLRCAIGELRIRGAAPDDGRSVIASRELLTLHQAIGTLSERERTVLEVVYIHHLRPITRVAEAIGISRQHFYRTLRSAAQSAHEAHLVILREPV